MQRSATGAGRAKGGGWARGGWVHLLCDRVAAFFRDVEHVHDAALQVGERGDGLHLDGVALLERLVQHARRVDDLPAQVLVVHVAHEERLCGEGVRLHVNVCARHAVHERRLADVGVACEMGSARARASRAQRAPGAARRGWRTCDDDCSSGRVDGRQPHHVLPHLLQVLERALLPLHNGAHSAERRALQRFAPVERVAVLEQLDIVTAHPVDELLGEVELAQSKLEVVAVVQHVDQIRVERVDVIQPREVGQDLRQLVMVVHVRELDLRRPKSKDVTKDQDAPTLGSMAARGAECTLRM
eukprot:scaffold6512_cov132-Isochrysis_galbana.AAC.3